jgi:hypothetical protein
MNERSVPYYCPFCGGEDLHPSAGAGPADGHAGGETGNAWECRECTRVFSVTLIGLVVSR